MAAYRKVPYKFSRLSYSFRGGKLPSEFNAPLNDAHVTDISRARSIYSVYKSVVTQYELPQIHQGPLEDTSNIVKSYHFALSRGTQPILYG